MKTARLLRVNPISGLILLALTFTLIGCRTASIESKKESGYSKTVNRLCVVSQLARVNREIGKEAEQAFVSRLSVLQLEFKYVTVDPLATSEDVTQYKKSQAEFVPDAVLVVRKTGGTVNQYGKIVALTVEAFLQDEASKKIIWRANIKTSRSAGGPSMSALVDKIIMDLQQANLIPSALRANR